MMPRQEVYVSLDGARQFNGRAEYLDYLRVRHRERLSWARLEAHRAAALQRLHGVRDLMDWQEVEDFINDHARDIDVITGSDHQMCDFKISITDEETVMTDWRRHPITLPDCESDQRFPAFRGKFQYRYRKKLPLEGREKAKAKSRDRWGYRERYDLPWRSSPFHSHTDVLSAIGMHSNGGGGSGVYVYQTILFTQDFDHLRVMSRLAA